MKSKICIVAFMSFVFSAQVMAMELSSHHQKLEDAAIKNDGVAFQLLIQKEKEEKALDQTQERKEFLDRMGYPDTPKVIDLDGTTGDELVEPFFTQQMKAYRGEIEDPSKIKWIEEEIKSGNQNTIEFCARRVKVLSKPGIRGSRDTISPLDVAIASGKSETVKLMMESSEGHAFDYLTRDDSEESHILALSKVTNPDMMLLLAESTQLIPEQKQCMLFTAIYSKNEKFAQELIRRSKIDVDVNATEINTYFPTFLLFAMSGLNLCTEAIMISLIDAGSFVDCVDYQKNTPLHRAVKWGCVTVLKILLEKMSSKFINAKNDEGNTALDLAITAENEEIVKILCEYEDLDINRVDDNGHTPLWKAAVDIKNEAIVSSILAHKHIEVNMLCRNRNYTMTVLHSVAYNGSLPIFSLLLGKEGIDVNIGNYRGRTVLDEFNERYFPQREALNKAKFLTLLESKIVKTGEELKSKDSITTKTTTTTSKVTTAIPNNVTSKLTHVEGTRWYQQPGPWIGLGVAAIVAVLIYAQQKYGTGFDFMALFKNLAPGRA